MHFGKGGEVVLWWQIEKQEKRMFCPGPDSQESSLSLSQPPIALTEIK